MDRFVGPIAPASDAYEVPIGASAHGGSAWGVTFSLNLQAGGGSLILGGVDAVLSLTVAATGFAETIPGFLALVVDSTCYGSSGVDASCTNATDFGVQNSEPGSALVALGDTNFSDLAPDTYTVTVVVHGCDATACETNLLATDTIQLDVLPEPGTIPLLGGALVALGSRRGVRRRRLCRATA